VEVEVAMGEAGGAGALAGAPGQGQPVGEVDAVGRVREAGHVVVVVEGAPPAGVGAAGRQSLLRQAFLSSVVSCFLSR
jgi:hypothetical protein